MDERLLTSFGLSQNLAKAYRALVLKKSLRPLQYAKLSGETRTNSYAILDRLVGMGLARKEDENKKLTYYPESPVVLESILAKNIAEEQAKLSSLQRKLPQMMSAFTADESRPRIELHEGKEQLLKVLELQAVDKGGDLRFVHTRADISFFGAEALNKIRWQAVKQGIRRYALSNFSKTFYNPAKDQKAKLRRTWLWNDTYKSPVEWSVRNNTLYITCLSGKGYGLEIRNKIIAESFVELFDICTKALRQDPAYAKNSELANKQAQTRKQTESETNYADL